MRRIRSGATMGVTFVLPLLFSGAASPEGPASTAYQEGDFVVRAFKFRSGETLPELKLHYTTLGTPHRGAHGHVDNAILILHGTGGDGHQFQRPQYAGVLFVPGGLLDPKRYFIILPDSIGHGKSSKPSDGLHARFPHYDYDDMVAAQYALVTRGLHVDHLRLVTGTSMGCMHSFVWGETFPDFMDALMPLACLPVQIAGRWVNSADDFINPPELGVAETMAKRIPHCRFVLIPISDQTHGHGTHTYAAVWQSYLSELLNESAR